LNVNFDIFRTILLGISCINKRLNAAAKSSKLWILSVLSIFS